MKPCLIVLITFCAFFNKIYGQSPSASIDSLIKYRVIADKERPVMDMEIKYLKDSGHTSYRVAILGGLENIMLKKAFHVDPHKTGIMVSYTNNHPNKKSQDSINTSLRLLLDKINKAGLLTDRVYTYI